MLSLSASSSSTSLRSSSSQYARNQSLPSPSPSVSSASSSASSSRLSVNVLDDENVTITANSFRTNGKQKSQEDLRLLAISTHITELTYSVSDIQTRIFEIQELRHKSQSGDASSASTVIDQSLAQLDECLEAVAQGVKAVNESMEPLLQSHKSNWRPIDGDDEEAVTIRKHATMLSEWEAVQKESQVLREELKEDKWLTVFRTVTDQADGMMSSLEKAINRCQDFIYQIHRRGPDDSLTISQSSSMSSVRSDKSTLNAEVFTTLLDSYEAKKKHYMPATTKVLSIIDKGVQDRVTKNGECLRRHAESTQRWRNLKERISRTDREMEAVRKLLSTIDVTQSESGSSASGITSHSRGGYLATPPSGSKSKKDGGTISRSMSPFRKLARKFRGAKSPSPGTPPPALPPLPSKLERTPEPTRTLRHRSSLFNLLGQHSPLTPERPSHKHSHSLTPDSSPIRKTDAGSTLKISRPAWNSSTRVAEEERANTLKPGTQRRASNAGMLRQSQDSSPSASVTSTPYRRSVSRSSMASSRPWSPVTSSASTAHSSTSMPLASLYRPPSRAQTPGLPVSPRSRPKTPSHIPRPSLTGMGHWRSMSASPTWDDDGPSTIMQRAFSPTRAETPSGHPPRPPSRSMIPLPSVQVSSVSRPSSAMSNHRPDSSMSFRGSALRSQTPDALRSTPRPGLRMPPSSFKDSGPRTPNRPPSRSGAATPSHEGTPIHVYVPGNPKDPLDAEVAAVANSMAHGLLIERIDPPLRSIPKEGEEIRAQYSFSSTIMRKAVTCKLTTLTRAGREHVAKKVMCRVGGGWQDLQVYIANRQAGM